MRPELQEIYPNLSTKKLEQLEFKIKALFKTQSSDPKLIDQAYSAFLAYRKVYPCAKIVSLTKAQLANNKNQLLHYLQLMDKKIEQILVTSQKEIKTLPSLFIFYVLNCLTDGTLTVAELKNKLSTQKVTIEGQPEQPIGEKTAIDCAQIRLNYLADAQLSHGITIESFIHSFAADELTNQDALVFDAAIIGLALAKSRIFNLFTESIAMPAKFINEVIAKTNNEVYQDGRFLGYKTTAGAAFAQQFIGCDAAAWQLTVSLEIDELEEQVFGLSRKGQLINGFLKTIAHFTLVDLQQITPAPDLLIAQLGRKIANALNELKIRPAEMLCHRALPIDLGLFGSLAIADDTGLFAAHAIDLEQHLSSCQFSVC